MHGTYLEDYQKMLSKLPTNSKQNFNSLHQTAELAFLQHPMRVTTSSDDLDDLDDLEAFRACFSSTPYRRKMKAEGR
eukprot:545392-Hanusia_phi.AAC.1